MIPLGVLFGIPLRMHAAFPVLMASAIFLGHGRVLVAMLVSLTAHEAAHALAARAMGQRFEAIELMPFGGVAQMRTVLAIRPMEECIIAVAGPIASLALSMGLALSGATGPFVRELIRSNVSLMLFNLLPALPLDGGRALRAICGIRMGRPRATNLFVRVGVCLGALVISLGVWAAVRGVINPMLFLTGVYLIYAAIKEKETLAAACVEALYGRAARLRREGTLPVRWLATPNDMPPERLITRLTAGSYHLFVLVDDQMRQVDVVDEGELLHRAFAVRIGE